MDDEMVRVSDHYGDAKHGVYLWDGEDKDAPVAGDTANMGFWNMMSDDDHRLADYRGREWARHATRYIEVPGTVWGDYVGSSYNRSNYDALLRDFPDTFVVLYSGFHCHNLLLPMDAMVPEFLIDVMRGLEDYPIYDEDHHSRLEMEMADECWESYGDWDLRRELRERGMDEDALDAIDSSRLYEVLRQAWEDCGWYAYAEDAHSVILWDAGVADTVAELLAA